MNEIQVNLLGEANYHKGVADGITRALQIIYQESEQAKEEEKKKWFGDAEDGEVAEE